MAKIDKAAVAAKYDQTYQMVLQNGIYRAREQFESQWMPYTKAPPGGGDNNRDNWLTADMNATDWRAFGRGNAVRFVQPEFWEQFMGARRQGLGFEIDYDDLSEDQIGKYEMVPFWLGYGFVQYQWLYFYELMTGPAFTASIANFLAADGVPLISDSHPYKDRYGATQTFSNFLPNRWSIAGWRAALDLRSGFRTLGGNRLSAGGSVETDLLLSTKNFRAAKEYFDANLINNGSTNTTEKPTRIILVDALDDLNEEAWYIVFRYPGMGGILAPMFHKVIEGYSLAMLDPNGDKARLAKKLTWIAEHKDGWAPGDPCAIFGSDGSSAAL